MATRRIIGVVEDGSPGSLSSHGNPRRTMRFTKGMDLTLELSVVGESGGNIDLTGGTIVMTVRKQTEPAETVVQKTATLRPEQGENRADLTFVANDFKFVTPGQFVYDIWLTTGSGSREPIVPTSPFLLEPTVTDVP